MADTTTTTAKTEVKTETKAGTKDKTSTDPGSGKKAESSTSDAPTGYSRGENQKPVTEAYRTNWDNIFSKQPRRRSKK
jgi:hypothetical protein